MASCNEVHLKPSSNVEKKTVSSYAKLLMSISNSLSESEYSQLRLALSVDSHLKTWRQGEINNAADLLTYMHQKKLISRSNLKMIEVLLVSIGREDLRCEVESYEKRHVVSFCVEDNKCEENDYTLEDDLPGSQESMKSLSDDEKLLRAGFVDLDKSLGIETEDVTMGSL